VRYPDEWRREARADARRRYPRGLVRELVGIVERGPGFRDAHARRWFPRWLWSWAAEELLLLRPVEPLPHKIIRDAAQEIYRPLHEAMALWGRMPAEARRYIAGQMSPLPTGGDLGAALDEHRKHREAATEEIQRFLVQLTAAAGGAAVHAGARIKAPRREGDALRRLAEVWLDATGRPPTVTKNPDTSARGGAFRGFAHAAMAPIWPGMGSIDGLIDKVIAEFRARRR
jgi:hypothetical protein